MNKLKTMLCAVFTLMLVNISTTAQSDSSNFAGPYIGISASGYGIQLDGSSNTSPTGGTYETDEVSIGQVAPVTGFEAGYVIPLGSHFLIDIGASLYTGEAKIGFENDNGTHVAAGDDPGADGSCAGARLPAFPGQRQPAQHAVLPQHDACGHGGASGRLHAPDAPRREAARAAAQGCGPPRHLRSERRAGRRPGDGRSPAEGAAGAGVSRLRLQMGV